MRISGPIAWAVLLLALAVGVYAVVGPAGLADLRAQLGVEMPDMSTSLSGAVRDTKLMVWDILSFAGLLVLLWTKLRG